MPTKYRIIASLAAVVVWLFVATSPAGAECIQGDCSNGTGVYLWPDGSRYEGGFKDDKFQGQGTYQWADGKKYVGTFRNNKRNGHGTYSWPNGSQYTGEWKEGTRHGQGTFTWANGSRYEGEWHQGQKRGLGIYTYPDGERNAGRWEAGEIVETMDPEVVAIKLAGPAAPLAPAPAPPDLPRPATDSPVMAQAPQPPHPPVTAVAPASLETETKEERGPAVTVEKPAQKRPEAISEDPVTPDLPTAFSLAIHKIPLVRKGKRVKSESLPLYPRGRSQPVGTCRVVVDSTGGNDNTGVVNLAIENRTGCHFAFDAFLRQNDTYLQLVSWSGEEAIGPKATKSLQEAVSLPKSLLSTDLTLKVQGVFQGCP